MKKLFSVMLMLLLLAGLSACAPDQPPAGTDTNAEAPAAAGKIVITGPGIGEREIYLTDIIQLPPVEREVVLVRRGGNEEELTVKGALLSDLLNTLGKDQKALGSIRLVAGDGYMIEVSSEILAGREIIMAYEINGQPLEEEIKPIRVVIPEERGMYWVKNLIKIEILEAREAQPLSRFLFLETAIQNLEHHDYEYHGSTDQAVMAADLFIDEEPEGAPETVYIKATDGLEKNEKWEVFSKGFLKFTGLDSPAFVSPDIPRGMHVKEILWLSRGDLGFISLESALGYFPKANMDNREGIKLGELFSEVSMAESDAYLFTAADGHMVEVNKEDIAKGLLFFMEDGEVSILFEGLSEKENIYSVRSLLSIEVGN